MYKIQIDTKQNKSYAFQVKELNDFLLSFSKSEIIWIDNGAKGFFIPPTEVAQILFEKLVEPLSQQEACLPTPENEDCTTEAVMDFARKEACIHQQQHVEG